MRVIVLSIALATLGACSREPPAPAPVMPAAQLASARVDLGGETVVNLPEHVGEWTRPAAGKRITAETIFDYMDGAGELYLAYRFDHLDVFDYKPRDASQGTILVEVYSMKTSDDAFGLLSNDWGGEPVPFDGGQPERVRARAVPSRRALYGAGLLRVWVKDRYVRILASRESHDSRQAVLTLGEAIMHGGPGLLEAGATTHPGLLRSFDLAAAAPRTPRTDRTCFFRSHLVLNSQYFLASQDILGLGPDVAAGTTECAPAAAGERPTRVIVVRYPSEARARAGLESFCKGYLPELAAKTPPAFGEAKTEHGWVAWRAKSVGLTIVLDAPDRAVGRHFAEVLVPVSDAWM